MNYVLCIMYYVLCIMYHVLCIILLIFLPIEQVMSALKAIGNLGVVSADVLRNVNNCVKDDKLSVAIRLAAVEASRSYPCNKSVTTSCASAKCTAECNHLDDFDRTLIIVTGQGNHAEPFGQQRGGQRSAHRRLPGHYAVPLLRLPAARPKHSG